MTTLTRFMLVFVLVLFAIPAIAGSPTQMWQCEMEDDATEAAVLAGAQAWLEAARKVKGGEHMQARVLFPVAVNAIGNADVWFVVTAPTFEEWGRFWDNYEGSEAAKLDHESEHVACTDSALWEASALQ